MHGHQYRDVLQYTLAQLQTFLAAIDRAERQALSNQLALNTTAHRGDSGAIKALQRALQGCG